LARLLVAYRRDRLPGMSRAPSRANPSGVFDLDVLDAERIGKGLAPRPRRESSLR
jgi:hypothetical protein